MIYFLISFILIAIGNLLILSGCKDMQGKKQCPFCKESIDKEAIKCPHCKSVLEEGK